MYVCCDDILLYNSLAFSAPLYLSNQARKRTGAHLTPFNESSKKDEEVNFQARFSKKGRMDGRFQ